MFLLRYLINIYEKIYERRFMKETEASVIKTDYRSEEWHTCGDAIVIMMLGKVI